MSRIYTNHMPRILAFLCLTLSLMWLPTSQASQQAELDYFQRLNTSVSGRISKMWGREQVDLYFSSIPSQSQRQEFPQVRGLHKTIVTIDDKVLPKEEDSDEYKDEGSNIIIDLSGIPNSNPQNIETISQHIKVLRDGNLIPQNTFEVTEAANKCYGQCNNITLAIRALRAGYWYQLVTSTMTLPPSAQVRKPTTVKITAEFKQRHLLDIKGLVLAVNTARHETAIFLDLMTRVDQVDSTNLLQLQKFNHQELSKSDSTVIWYQRINGEISSYPTISKSYNFLLGDTWNDHVDPDLVKFKTLLGEEITVSQLRNLKVTSPNLSQKSTHAYQPVFISPDFEESTLFSSFRSVRRIYSDYLYSDGHGKFFATKAFDEIWTLARSGEEKQVKTYYKTNSEIRFHSDVRFLCSGDNFTSNWPVGVYKQSENLNGRQTWQLVSERSVEFEIESNGIIFTWPKWYNVLKQMTDYNCLSFIPSIKLDYSGQEITSSFVSSLKTWTKITSLDLSRVKLQGPKWQEVFEGIGELKDLRELKLGNNKLGYRDIDSFVKSVKKLTQLLHLDLHGNVFLCFDPKYYDQLCKSISQNCKSLQVLFIDNLPGHTYYPAKGVFVLPLLILDATFTNGPAKFLKSSSESLTSLPNLNSIYLYEKDGEGVYNFSQQNEFEKKLKEIATNQGKANISITRSRSSPPSNTQTSIAVAF